MFQFPEAARNFSLEHRDRIRTRPPIQRVLVAVSPGVKRKCMNLCIPVHLAPRFQKRSAVSPLPNIRRSHNCRVQLASYKPVKLRCRQPTLCSDGGSTFISVKPVTQFHRNVQESESGRTVSNATLSLIIGVEI